MALIFSAWKYKYEINISNPQTSSGFQAQIEVSWKPGMRADFRDIRFSSISGTELKHYRESYTSFSTAKFWIKLPANDVKILMYYGNGAVSSASSGADTFEFWDDFSGSAINTSVWAIGGSGGAVSNSVLTLQNSSLSGYVESKTSFPPNTFVEIKAMHQSGQRGPLGYRSNSTKKAVAWQGAAGVLTTDHRFSHNGTSGDWDNDGVDRSGSYHVYGVAHVAAGPRYYVDYSYRGTITTPVPGAVNLPVEIYAYYGEGYVKADWARVRKYTATEPVLSFGLRIIQHGNGFLQQHDYIDDSISSYSSVIGTIRDIFTDDVPSKSETGFAIGQPDLHEESLVSISTLSEENVIDRDELKDYSLISCDISRSITDAYMQLSAQFADDKVPDEESTVKYCYDYTIIPRTSPLFIETSDGLRIITSDVLFPTASDAYETTVKLIVFHGKVVSKTPRLSFLGDTVVMQAADLSRNLSAQKVPWKHQVVSLTGQNPTWASWIITLVDTNSTGVRIDYILDTGKPDKQFVFNPSTSRLDAIKEIAAYAGCILNTKLNDYIVDEKNVIAPGLSAVPPEDIDIKFGGFNLPTPITFSWPDSTIIDDPEIVSEQDTKYNKVIVHGKLSDTGETTVAAAYTPRVYTGEEKAHEYVIEDNLISEKGSTAEIEAIKWLIYFNSQRATVSMKFVRRFDLELYQRIRFGYGFSHVLRDLTSTDQLPYVVAYDPRDEANSTHTVDVSGVPRPTWLRITEINYHSEECVETCEIKAVTDFIYSSTDPLIKEPYSQYISAGYFKPVSDAIVSTVQGIVDNTIEKQLTPEICTVLSKNEETKTMVVQTQSGKLVTVYYG